MFGAFKCDQLRRRASIIEAMMKIEESKAIEVAEAMLGIPYASGGRDGAGMDCWGVMRAFYLAFGLDVPDPASTDVDFIFAHRVMDYFIAVDSPKTGDVARFAGVEAGKHIGIVLGKEVLHAHRRTGVVIHPLHRFHICAPYFRLKELVA